MSDIDLKALREEWEADAECCGWAGVGIETLGAILDRLESAERRAEEAEKALAAKPKRDWQARCLERGFEYVREPDDHYVLADAPEMAGLLGELLGVEVRTKENDSYGETVSQLRDELYSASDAYQKAYEVEQENEALRKDKERLDSGRIMTHERDEFGMEYQCDRRGLDLRAMIDAAMAQEGGAETPNRNSGNGVDAGVRGGAEVTQNAVPVGWLEPATYGPGTNSGHGHAWARPDGLLAKCGGPSICPQCAGEAIFFPKESGK